MRAATVFESMRNEAQQAKQEAADLHVENVRLKAQVARLRAPVSDEEFIKHCSLIWIQGEDTEGLLFKRDDVDALLAARAAEPKEEPKP